MVAKLLHSPILTSHSFLLPTLPFIGNHQNGIVSRQRNCKLHGRIMASWGDASLKSNIQNGLFCRRELVAIGFSTSLSLLVSFSGSDAEEEVKMASMVDETNAYSYLYPVELPPRKLVLKWVESRKPERYSSAAPLSPNARLRIVSERVDFIDNLILSVSIGPPNADILKSKEKSTWSAKDVADSVLSDKSALRVTTTQRLAESSVLDANTAEVSSFA
ncbi:OLC1v1030135C2 [Oldenlandia corymbosa var. corymbosa]|uniref:OLC1v1030135C2 n=1 Tax=Oldenlandia corymbosa var. corymbosa TaxID=529605 RepID=A0AAV1CH88_OLDCO|nr:OLC1v1030135C2 [Oldenlandia corymbosa var. corymbosa]